MLRRWRSAGGCAGAADMDGMSSGRPSTTDASIGAPRALAAEGMLVRLPETDGGTAKGADTRALHLPLQPKAERHRRAGVWQGPVARGAVGWDQRRRARPG